MAVTRLERKGRRNVSKAKRAKQIIKSLNAKPRGIKTRYF